MKTMLYFVYALKNAKVTQPLLDWREQGNGYIFSFQEKN